MRCESVRFSGRLSRHQRDFPEHRPVAVAHQLARLARADLVRGQVQLGHRVKAVQDVQRAGAVLLDQIQIGLPHVRAHELDLAGQVLADQVEELLECLLGALLAHPQQARAARLDLVDQPQILMSLAVGDLVHADGPDRSELAMLKPPLHDIGHRLLDLLPTGVQGLRGLLPGQLARPVGQVQHVGLGQLMLARAPGHLLDLDPAQPAVHPPHAVE